MSSHKQTSSSKNTKKTRTNIRGDTSRSLSGNPESLDGLQDSPARVLAPNILREIFLFSLPGLPYPCQTQSPLSISQVCRRWRRIVHSTPHLWSSLSLVLHWDPSSTQKSHKGFNPRLFDEWIGRSNDLPLFLQIDSNRPSSEWEHQFSRLVKCLLRVCERWATLYLRIDLANIANVMEETEVGGCPRLQQLVLDPTGNRDYEGEERVPIKLDPSFAPSLSDITLGELIYLEPNTAQRHLRVLSTGRLPVPPNYLLHFLRHCPRIEELYSEIAVEYKHGENWPRKDKGTRLTLSHMSVLKLDAGDEDLAPFLDVLAAPSLTTLHFTCDADELPKAWRHLGSFIRRSRASVKDLRINDTNPDDLRECLRSSKDATVLAGGESLTTLINAGELNGDDLVPHLRQITLEELGETVHEELIIKMIASRGRRRNPRGSQDFALRTVFIASHPDVDVERIKQDPSLRDMISKGLEISEVRNEDSGSEDEEDDGVDGTTEGEQGSN